MGGKIWVLQCLGDVYNRHELVKDVIKYLFPEDADSQQLRGNSDAVEKDLTSQPHDPEQY